MTVLEHFLPKYLYRRGKHFLYLDTFSLVRHFLSGLSGRQCHLQDLQVDGHLQVTSWQIAVVQAVCDRLWRLIIREFTILRILIFIFFLNLPLLKRHFLLRLSSDFNTESRKQNAAAVLKIHFTRLSKRYVHRPILIGRFHRSIRQIGVQSSSKKRHHSVIRCELLSACLMSVSSGNQARHF